MTIELQVVLFGLFAVLVSSKWANGYDWDFTEKLRHNFTKCDADYKLMTSYKNWDYCSGVSSYDYGGDYNLEYIPSPNKIKEEDSMIFARRSCFCDQNCSKYGDCCIDVAQKTYESGLHIEQHKWACAKLPGSVLGTINSIYTIGICSQEWEDTIGSLEVDHVTKSRCTMDRKLKADYTQHIPVASNDTGIVYRNIYCAICNNDYNVKKWTVNIGCSEQVPSKELENGKYLTNDNYYDIFRHWEFEYNNKTARCHIIVDEFRDGSSFATSHNARACKMAIDTCHPKWRGNKERELCKMYASYLYYEWDVSEENLTIYKNFHCARCNFMDMRKLICVANERVFGSLSYQTLSVLFDFNIKSGYEVGKRDDGCSPGEVFDRLRQRCFALHCGRLYKMADEKCIRDKNAQFFNNSLQTSCKTISLSPNEYLIMPNQTILVNNSNRLYGLGEYEFVDTSNLTSELRICLEGDYRKAIKFSSAQAILSNICLYISAACLLMLITSYALVPKLRNLPGKNLLCLSSSLLACQLLFLFGIHQTEIPVLCSIIGVAIYFTFLAYFFWMNVMALDIFWTFSSDSYRPSSSSKTFVKYSCYAWTMPAIFSATAIGLDHINELNPIYRPGFGKGMCWITQRYALIVFLALPIAILMLINIVMFLKTSWHIKKSDNLSRRATHQKDRKRLYLYIKLALIMGITWILAFIAAFAEQEVIWYLYIIFNGLQGAFIFFAFSCKRKVLRLMKESVSGKSTSETNPSTKSKRSTVSTNINSRNGSRISSKLSSVEVSLLKKSKKPESRLMKRTSKNLAVSTETDA